jgi:hypothetical protein
MTISKADTYLLPRPLERLPEFANAKSRQALADRLSDAVRLPPDAASAIANGVVDPSEVRKSIGEPESPDLEHIPVPGGTLFGIRTSVWARRVMPDARNPRLLPSRRHPFAVDPGTAGEDAKFRPVPEPRSPSDASPQIGQLVVDIESRHHLNWACQQAAGYVIAENDWRMSIKYHGVMEAVWLTATTYEHADGSQAVTVLTTAEGSSRVTAVHDLLHIASADVPYDDNEAKLRSHIRKLNDAFQRGATGDDIVALRCERIPALILLGFEPYPGVTTGFPTAVKSLVALRHVDPPKPWGEGPENESLADEVLDEFHRRGHLSKTQRDYFAGSCTRAEARAAHLSDDPTIRAAQIVRLFTSPDERHVEAIRAAVTSQSTRKRITQKLLNEMATALILRAMAEDRERTDQVRRYMRHAFGGAVHEGRWESTDRSVDELTTAAVKEVRRAIGDETIPDPGPSSLELAIRGAYALVVSGRLNADRGTASNDQPDRRTPGQVLDTMRRSIQGAFQLGQSLRDFARDGLIRAVDEDGNIKRTAHDAGDDMVSDFYLRSEFPPPGKARAPRPGETPLDFYRNAVNALDGAVEAVQQAFQELAAVDGHNGRPVVEERGVDLNICRAWRKILKDIDDEIVVWARTYKRTMGAPVTDGTQSPEEADQDELLENNEEMDAVDLWDAENEEQESAR